MFPSVNAPHQCSRMTKGSGGGRSEAGAVGEGRVAGRWTAGLRSFWPQVGGAVSDRRELPSLGVRTPRAHGMGPADLGRPGLSPVRAEGGGASRGRPPRSPRVHSAADGRRPWPHCAGGQTEARPGPAAFPAPSAPLPDRRVCGWAAPRPARGSCGSTCAAAGVRRGTLPAPFRHELGRRRGRPASGVSARRGRPRGLGGRGAGRGPGHSLCCRPAACTAASSPPPRPGFAPGLREPGSGRGLRTLARGERRRREPWGDHSAQGPNFGTKLAIVTATSEPPPSSRGVYTCGWALLLSSPLQMRKLRHNSWVAFIPSPRR